jgi:diguanylate cyclase (GGDEF)-like protein
MTLDSLTDGARLAALERLGILDSEPEPSFDRFTRLAAQLLGVPVALVSLVDRDRQFFKSQYGLAAPWANARQTPLSHSFCQYVVQAKEPLAIEDTQTSALGSDNLAIRDLTVAAYAGVPLILRDGHAVGAFCAIDTAPRQWQEQDLTILEDLGAAVVALLEYRRATAEESLHDPLTGLPGRSLTAAYARQLSSGQSGDLLAVAVGIDDLTAINDAYGGRHGDRVISLVGKRLARHLGPEDVVGRTEGSVFTVLRPGTSDQLEAVELTQRIRDDISSEPFTVRGQQLPVTVTVGLATGSPGSVETINHAAQAMRLARTGHEHLAGAGAGAGAGVGAGHETAAEGGRRIRDALRGAVKRGEISVVFQPIVELSTGCTRGFEALARWHHPELGPISPNEFIPVAEATGEVVAIGEHVLRLASRQLADWRARWRDDLQMTVNFSPVQLAVPNIPEVIGEILSAAGLPGSALGLEITEGVFMTSGVLERRNLEAIRRLGVRIALDDFGTGYSALSYLKRFPVDVIKADRSFLDGLGADRRDLAVLRAILAIGAGMDIQVVAEGVETQRQRELLRLSGCPYGQGFLFSEPLPADKIEISRRPGRTGRPVPVSASTGS